MAILDDLSYDLRRVANREAGRRVRKHRMLKITALATSIVVLGSVAAAAAMLWSPDVGDDHRGRPAIARSVVPGNELTMLSILSREQTAADRAVLTQGALRLLDRSVEGVRVDGARALGSSGAVLVPVERALSRDGGRPIDDALCLFIPDPRDGGGLACFSAGEVHGGRAVIAMGAKVAAAATGPIETNSNGSHFRRSKGIDEDVMHVVGVAPDGISVAHIGNGQSSRTVGVTDNFFEASMPLGHNLRVEWGTPPDAG
jgi:hypothetical protein